MRNSDIIQNIIYKYNSYNVRPLAFLSDVFLFQWFWNNMYILLIAMLTMHVCNLFFIYKIAEKIGIKLNAFSLTLFALSPILVEALYWISASTRIVFSLFLCLASIYLLLLHFDEENKKKRITLLVCSIILNLMCVGYYEQTIALNLFLFAYILILLKKYKYLFIPIISTTWIGIWYLYFMMNGQMQKRGALALNGFLGRGVELVKNINKIYNNSYSNFIYSLKFGVESVLHSLVSILLLGLIVAFIWYIFKNKNNNDENKFIWQKIVLGLIIFVVPFMPFLVLETSFLAVRNMYISTLGLAIILECIVDLILKFIKNENVCNIIKTFMLVIAIVPFVISNLDGVNNYKKVNELDNKVASQIINALDDDVFNNKKSISINYDASKLAEYKNLSNYVESVIESDWAMAGKLQVMRHEEGIGKIYINTMQDEADVSVFFDNNMNLVSVVMPEERNVTIYE